MDEQEQRGHRGSDAHEHGDHGEEVGQEAGLLPIDLVAVLSGVARSGCSRGRTTVARWWSKALHGKDEEI
ncbi:hypothetical protein [Streptomyces adustus]